MLALGLGSYALRLLGLSLAGREVVSPVAARFLALLPGPLLAALVVVQTVGQGAGLTVDARLPAVLVAAAAVALRAPVVVVLAVAIGTAAALRAAGWAA